MHLMENKTIQSEVTVKPMLPPAVWEELYVLQHHCVSSCHLFALSTVHATSNEVKPFGICTAYSGYCYRRGCGVHQVNYYFLNDAMFCYVFHNNYTTFQKLRVTLSFSTFSDLIFYFLHL